MKQTLNKMILFLPIFVQKSLYLLWFYVRNLNSIFTPKIKFSAIAGKNMSLPDLRLIGFIKIKNEASSGNLQRTLRHLKIICDEIVVCDCASTDNSVEVARRFTTHILHDTKTFEEELVTKQKMLDYTLMLNPDWIVWLDADEIFDRNGEEGGIRELCHYAEKMNFEGVSFLEYNLWGNEEYYRTDELWLKGWYVRLWKNTGSLRFNVRFGLHNQQYPQGILRIARSDIKVIHYGFSTHDLILRKYQQYKKHHQEGFLLDRMRGGSHVRLELADKLWFPKSTVVHQK